MKSMTYVQPMEIKGLRPICAKTEIIGKTYGWAAPINLTGVATNSSGCYYYELLSNLEKLMSTTKKLPYVAAGFIGGVAFLISCGGGSGGGSGSELISEADAYAIEGRYDLAVPTNQMVCEMDGRLMATTGGGIPTLPSSLVCYDSSGTGRTITIADAYAEGWRIQIATGVAPSVRYIFEK